MKKLSWWKFLALTVMLVAPLTVACGKTVGETIDDTTITTRVKTAMLNDPAVGGLGIDVDTFKGRVRSEAERTQAVSLARRVNGVSEVKDALQIVPEGQQPAPAATPAPATPAPPQK